MPPSKRRISSTGDRYHSSNRNHEDSKDYYRSSAESGTRGQKKDVNRRDTGKSKSRNSNSKPSMEWPPPFESAGASYVFDSRSGFFYEAASAFFYDPKTKLYFGNKEQKYYQYFPNDKPAFREVLSQQNEVDSAQNQAMDHAGDDLLLKALGGTPSDGLNQIPLSKKTDKKKLGISLKIKTSFAFKGTTPPAPTEVASASSANNITESQKLKKNHEKDMQKWSQRGLEMCQDKPEVVHILQTSGNIQSVDSNKDALVKIPADVKLTVSGKPICTLCKRKFPNVEKLRHHEKVSALHKQNVAKKKISESKEKLQEGMNSTEYRDRAKERRTLYGPDQATEHDDTSLELRNIVATEIVAPDQNLGKSNVGNQMLQKLGWKGGSLGREDSITQNNGGSTADNLKKDWERIESLSGSQNR